MRGHWVFPTLLSRGVGAKDAVGARPADISALLELDKYLCC